MYMLLFFLGCPYPGAREKWHSLDLSGKEAK